MGSYWGDLEATVGKLLLIAQAWDGEWRCRKQVQLSLLMEQLVSFRCSAVVIRLCDKCQKKIKVKRFTDSGHNIKVLGKKLLFVFICLCNTMQARRAAVTKALAPSKALMPHPCILKFSQKAIPGMNYLPAVQCQPLKPKRQPQSYPWKSVSLKKGVWLGTEVPLLPFSNCCVCFKLSLDAYVGCET